MKGTDLQFRAPRFIWDGRMPTGGLSYIAGPSSAGKSTLAARLAADLTTGALTGTPESVVMVMLEDNDETTNGPRFTESGGDLSRLVLPRKRNGLSFPRDIEYLRGLMEGQAARIVFIDPLTSVVPGLTTQSARHILDELHRAAEEDDIAVVFLHHFIKDATNRKSVKEAMAGGHHVYNLARSIHVFGWEPNGGERFVLAHEKMSGAALQPSLVYARRLVPHPMDEKQTLSVLDSVQAAEEYTALEVAHEPKPDGHGSAAARSFILKVLASEEAMAGQDLAQMGEEAGFGSRCFNGARADLHHEGQIASQRKGQSVVWLRA